MPPSARSVGVGSLGGHPGTAPVSVQGRSRVLSHPGLRDCRIGQLVGGPQRACPTPRATDAAAGGVWPEATLAGYRPPSYAQLGNDPAGHRTRTTTIASRGASEAAQGGAGSRRAGRWQASAGRGLCGAGPPLHRIPRSQWASPFVQGHTCTTDDWLPLYVDFVLASLQAELPALQGKRLACDCGPDGVCEADALAGMVFDATHPDAETSLPRVTGRRHRQARGSVLRAAAIMGSLRGGDALQSMPLWFPQEDVILAFRKLYPAEWFQSFQWPMLEDLLNQAPFTCYLDWRQSRGMEWDGPLGPPSSSNTSRRRQRLAWSLQPQGLHPASGGIWAGCRHPLCRICAVDHRSNPVGSSAYVGRRPVVCGQHGGGQRQPEGAPSGVHRGHQGAEAQVGAGVQAPRGFPVRGHPRGYLEARSRVVGTLRRYHAVGRLRPPSRIHQGPTSSGLRPSLRCFPLPARRGDRPLGGIGWLGGAQCRHYCGSEARFHGLLRPRAVHEGSQGGVLHPSYDPEPAQAVRQRRPLPAHTSVCHHTGVR